MTDYRGPTCGGPGVGLGYLGDRYWCRCRDCGIDYSVFVEVGLAEELERLEEEVPA